MFISTLQQIPSVFANSRLDDCRTEVLHTLTSVTYADRTVGVNTIIDALGGGVYHGHLARMMREAVAALREHQLASPGDTTPASASVMSIQYCTAIFSFVYHLVGNELGSDAALQSGLTDPLLDVINDYSLPFAYITFITRAVRVLDIITAIEQRPFDQADGLGALLKRLNHEVQEVCRKEQPFELKALVETPEDEDAVEVVRQRYLEVKQQQENEQPATTEKPRCAALRIALLKSLLNFLKRLIQDDHSTDVATTAMNSKLPDTLKHIISNPDYYTAALFQNAIAFTSLVIRHDPSQLGPNVQHTGLASIIFEALFERDLPTHREILHALPATLGALCMNNAGVKMFMAFEPFDKLFDVLLSSEFLHALKRRRSHSSHHNEWGAQDTPSAIGVATADLMAQSSDMRTTAIDAMVRLMRRLADKFTADISDEQEVTNRSQYLANTMTFADVVFRNSDTAAVQASAEFVDRGGLEPLLIILSSKALGAATPASASGVAQVLVHLLKWRGTEVRAFKCTLTCYL